MSTAPNQQRSTYRPNPYNTALDVITALALLLGLIASLGDNSLLAGYAFSLGAVALIATLTVHAIRHHFDQDGTPPTT